MKQPITEDVSVTVTFKANVEATFVWEEYEPGVGRYVLDQVDEDELYHAVLSMLNDGNFDYEVEE